MPKLTSVTGAGSLKGDDSKDIETFAKNVGRFLEELQPLINGKLEFDSNIASQTVTQYFSAANTDTAVQHDLKKTGLKYFVCDKPAACDVYHVKTQDTKESINLRSTVAGVTLSILLF